MKVAFVCPDDLSTIIFAKTFIRKLRENNGHKIYTISPVVQDYLGEIERLGAIHIPIQMYRYVSPTKDLQFMLSLYKICSHKKFDLVINWTTKPNVFGTFSEKLAGVPRVINAVRGLGGPFLPRSGFKLKFLRNALTILYRMAGALSERTWFTNKGDLDYFLHHKMIEQHKTILTKNAVSLLDFSPDAVDYGKFREVKEELRISSNDKVVVMVARMVWSKGIKEFVEASKMVSRKNSDVKFILVAPLEEGHADSVPESYIIEKQKAGDFQWLGFRRDVKEIYALSDIAILPSYYKEGGYPRALLEPMALGKPVITTDIPECSGPVEEGKNGYLVPAKDSRALANAVQLLINDSNKRLLFGQYSRKKIEKDFDDEKIVEKILKELALI